MLCHVILVLKRNCLMYIIGCPWSRKTDRFKYGLAGGVCEIVLWVKPCGKKTDSMIINLKLILVMQMLCLFDIKSAVFIYFCTLSAENCQKHVKPLKQIPCFQEFFPCSARQNQLGVMAQCSWWHSVRSKLVSEPSLRVHVPSYVVWADVLCQQLGGTVGDIESMPFIEAFRQFQFKVKKENFCNIHVSLIPQVWWTLCVHHSICIEICVYLSMWVLHWKKLH